MVVWAGQQVCINSAFPLKTHHLAAFPLVRKAQPYGTHSRTARSRVRNTQKPNPWKMQERHLAVWSPALPWSLPFSRCCSPLVSPRWNTPLCLPRCSSTSLSFRSIQNEPLNVALPSSPNATSRGSRVFLVVSPCLVTRCVAQLCYTGVFS